MQSHPAVSSSIANHDFLGSVAGGRQMSLQASHYDSSDYDHSDIKPFVTTASAQHLHHTPSFSNGYVSTSTSSTYNAHAIPDHTSGWPPATSPSFARPRSMFGHADPASYGMSDAQRRQTRADPLYGDIDTGAHGQRRAPSSYPTVSAAPGREVWFTNEPSYSYSPGYPYQQSPLDRTTASHRTSSPTSRTSTRCEWGPGRCGMYLEDPSPSGIARHLRQHHDVPVTDNRNRGMCVWGGRCGKDMFPSSYGKHVAECHLRNMTKQCPYCGADFARADTLSRHVKAFCPNSGHGR